MGSLLASLVVLFAALAQEAPGPDKCPPDLATLARLLIEALESQHATCQLGEPSTLDLSTATHSGSAALLLIHTTLTDAEPESDVEVRVDIMPEADGAPTERVFLRFIDGAVAGSYSQPLTRPMVRQPRPDARPDGCTSTYTPTGSEFRCYSGGRLIYHSWCTVIGETIRCESRHY